MKPWIIPAAVAAVAAGAIGIGVLVVEDKPEAASQAVEPGGDPASAELAQNNPDEFAWRLFEYANLEAAPNAAGVAVPGAVITSYGDDRSVVWETWALASGNGSSQQGSEVYRSDGSPPSAWESLPRGAPAQKVFSVDLKLAAASRAEVGLPELRTTRLPMPNIFIGPGNPTGDFEVRMNKPAFEFVRANELYNIEGLAAKYQAAVSNGNRDLVQFPQAAKEVKAVWRPTAGVTSISVDEKARYHWRKVGPRYYKLAGFHITTKDIKQWFWADFAHEDYETTPGPALPSRDATTRGPGAPARGSKDGERKELIGSKWAHYRLRGTQIDFLDAANKPVVVGNTLIEQGVADKSSCMTCHFHATMGPVVNGRLRELSGGDFVVGKPNPDVLGTGTNISFLQNDFVWSAPFRAQHKAVK